MCILVYVIIQFMIDRLGELLRNDNAALLLQAGSLGGLFLPGALLLGFEAGDIMRGAGVNAVHAIVEAILQDPLLPVATIGGIALCYLPQILNPQTPESGSRV